MRIIIKVIAVLMMILISSHSYAQEAHDEYLMSKGRMFSTLTFSMDQRKAENEDQLIRFVVDQNRFNYRIVGSGGIAVMDNLTLGLGVGYGRQREDITFLDENDEEITTKRIQQGLALVPTMRTYVPLGKGRLQILVQTELNLTIGESLQRNYYTNDVDKIRSDFFESQLGVSPGAILFFNRNWAFETTVGLAGISLRYEEEITNNDTGNSQKVLQSGVDLQLNLLQLNLGVAYYLD